MNAKEEAEKIITEILEIVGSNCEHDFYCADSECNVKGINICKVDYETARKLAVLQVKGIIKELKKVYIGLPLIAGLKVAVRVDGQISSWRSILTELERK